MEPIECSTNSFYYRHKRFNKTLLSAFLSQAISKHVEPTNVTIEIPYMLMQKYLIFLPLDETLGIFERLFNVHWKYWNFPGIVDLNRTNNRPFSKYNLINSSIFEISRNYSPSKSIFSIKKNNFLHENNTKRRNLIAIFQRIQSKNVHSIPKLLSLFVFAQRQSILPMSINDSVIAAKHPSAVYNEIIWHNNNGLLKKNSSAKKKVSVRCVSI